VIATVTPVTGIFAIETESDWIVGKKKFGEF
jgi:hypothetical protein